MHNQDTINQFVELRARSVPYAQIAEHLKVSRCTLIAWGQKYKMQIDALRSVHAEAIRAKYLGTHEQEVVLLAQRLQRLETTFDQHTPIHIPIRQLTDMIRLTRNRLDKLCAEPVVMPETQTREGPPPTLQPMNQKTRLFPDRRTVGIRAFPNEFAKSPLGGLVLESRKPRINKWRALSRARRGGHTHARACGANTLGCRDDHRMRMYADFDLQFLLRSNWGG